MMQQNHYDAMSELFLTFGLIYLHYENKDLALENLQKAKSNATNIEVQAMIDSALDLVQREANESTINVEDQS